MSMPEMKYVVVESDECGEQLVIFLKNIDHDQMAEILSYIKHGGVRWTRPIRMPISAGFTDGNHCYGRSELLNLKSRPEDTALLKAGGMKEPVTSPAT